MGRRTPRAFPDAYIPERWAMESLLLLYANTVMLPLVHRDFKNEVAKHGDIVNTRRPGTLTGKRKADGDTITFSRPTETAVQVPLDQHVYNDFVLYDGELTKSFKDLVAEFLAPCMEGIAQMVDQIIMGQMYSFMHSNCVGNLGTAPDEDDILAVQYKMNANKAFQRGRNFVVTPYTQSKLLSVAEFVEADKLGDDGSALREGALGKIFGFNFFMSQNAPSIASGSSTKAGAVNNVSDYAAGATSIIFDGFSTVPVDGEWCTIAGDMTPQLITAVSGSAGAGTLTIYPGLRNAVVNDAVITVYTAGAINNASDYALGWNKAITIDGFTVAPKPQQLITIGAGASTLPLYSTINTPTTTSMYLNRSLDDALAVDNALVSPGPSGEYNFAFHKNAISFVNRPLAKPIADGVKSAVVNYGGLSLRVTIAYDIDVQGHKIVVDLLCGTKVLDTNLGCVMLA